MWENCGKMRKMESFMILNQEENKNPSSHSGIPSQEIMNIFGSLKQWYCNLIQWKKITNPVVRQNWVCTSSFHSENPVAETIWTKGVHGSNHLLTSSPHRSEEKNGTPNEVRLETGGKPCWMLAGLRHMTSHDDANVQRSRYVTTENVKRDMLSREHSVKSDQSLWISFHPMVFQWSS